MKKTKRNGPRRHRAEITEPTDLQTVISQLLGGYTSASGAAVTVDSAQRFAAVAACVRVLTNSIAHLPLVLFRKTSSERQPATDLPVYRLLHDRPNEWQTSFQWRKLKQRDLLYRGNAFSLKVRGFRGDVQELLRLHPDRVQPKQDERTLAVSYVYTRADGRRVELARQDVLHLWSDSDDGVTGLNPIRLHRETIGDGLAMREHGSRFFSNGAKPLGILQAAGKIGNKAEMRQDFESLYAGGQNAHRVAILDQGVEYKPVSISMEDAQYLEGRKFNRSEIAGIFGVPPHKIADLDRSTNNNIEHQALEFVTDSLAPWLVCWEQCIGRDLLDNDPSLYVKHNVDALLRGDSKSRAEALQIQRRNGVINANEWRALEDRNPRTDLGGDEFIVEGNMVRQTGGMPVEPGGTQS
ncbi:phage portal protein [Azospirillum sp.]|uniref:phage portal protein n=1 Tax=Azospirillum sp. TaxID=34012 RepID=UPI002D74F75F|nr:phage portal protein [Azospirillum sp.]HYF87418.1 phage portal protein [Azospirillum sp.]